MGTLEPFTMSKISSGIKALDRLIDSLHMGHNVVWEVDAGTSYDVFMLNFIRQSCDDAQKVIYVSFNRSPQSILNYLHGNADPEHLVLVDCFTSGKGKNDATFLKYYDKPAVFHVVRVNNPQNIETFTEMLNSIEDGLPSGARYVFDSLTGMQDLWGEENSTYKFFTYMCPRLFDLETVAYWVLEKDAHSQQFKANLRHITQDVFDLYVRRDRLFIKALKLTGRKEREAFKPHVYAIEDGKVEISLSRKEISSDLGGRLKDLRTKSGLSQKDLADKIDVTPSFISQLENNQISPSLHSFIQMCRALGVTPAHVLAEDAGRSTSWLVKRANVSGRLIPVATGVKEYIIVDDDKLSARMVVIGAGTALERHFHPLKRPELIHLVRGTVSITVDGKTEQLQPGDSVFLRDIAPVQWKNEGGDEAELIEVW
ncbi:MAG: helix-turn-helix domain-containing protein [Nitrospirae bacterium]|nr:helix-turn-helix domain-containing protein [Nitrospirota bacterium]